MKRFLAEVVIAALLLLSLVAIFRLIKSNNSLRHRHENNVRALSEEVTAAKFRDSLSQASVRSLELKAREAERLCASLSSQLEEQKIRMKDVKSASAVQTVTSDTVLLESPAPMVAVPSWPSSDTCLHYSDRWASLDICPSDGALSVAYSIRDSVSTVVHVHYAKKFLWFRWRPEFRATSFSANPNTTIFDAAAVVISE